MINALSIDVEEYFQVTGLERAIPRDEWESIPSRLDVGLNKVLEILAKHNVKATFFFLGWVAERHPDSVKRVAEQGHEIASHGYGHKLIYTQTPEEFEEDLRMASSAIRDVYDGQVLGYRAPSFSITRANLWALDVIKKFGFKYDSSIFPFKRKRYGIEGAPTKPYEVIDGLLEFPLSTVQILGKAFPVCGGGYFRLYPFAVTCLAFEKLNRADQPVVVYLHPWEFDPDQPKVPVELGNGFRHRVNLDKTSKRLNALCQRYDFAPLREVLSL